MGNKKKFFRFLKKKKWGRGGGDKEQEAIQIVNYPFACGMGKEMVHPNKGILLSSKKEWTADTCKCTRLKIKIQSLHTKKKKKACMLYDSIYMTCWKDEWANHGLWVQCGLLCFCMAYKLIILTFTFLNDYKEVKRFRDP